MDKQMDTLTVRHRSQNQNDEDLWISSEDLRTEGSSDEEGKPLKYRQRKGKHSKKTQRKPQRDSFSEDRNQSGIQFKIEDTEMGKKPEDSEMNWRPKRGSLTLPNINEEPNRSFPVENNANYIKHANYFYEEMMNSIKLLKNPKFPRLPKIVTTPSSEEISEPNPQENSIDYDLNLIRQLDEEIEKVLGEYEVEKRENTECPESETNLNAEVLEKELLREENELEKNKKGEEKKDLGLVKRNIELAKAGSLAQWSLTDEEKQKLEDILQSDDCNDPDQNDQVEDKNAFKFLEEDKAKLKEIDAILKEFKDINRLEKKEKTSRNDDFFLKKSLCDLNSKLEAISVKKDEEGE